MTKKEKPFKPQLVRGVGINDADYNVSRGKYEVIEGVRKWRTTWKCPIHQHWVNMLRRCYSADAYTTYEGCYVCTDWLTFSNFRAWVLTQEYEGFSLDKDLLYKANKVYSPTTCVFIDHKTNCFLHDGKSWRGEYLLGVSFHQHNKMFRSRCRNPFTKSTELLGYFHSESAAHYAYCNRKLELATQLSTLYTDPRIQNALLARFNKETNYDN